MAAWLRPLFGRLARLLLTCVACLTLAAACNLPQPPIPTRLQVAPAVAALHAGYAVQLHTDR